MRELASHLGLTAGSLYHHFPSKQHLLFDLIEELFEELLATLQPRGRGKPEATALSRVIKAHWALHAERPLQFRLAERDLCCLSEEQQARIAQLRREYETRLLQLIALTRPCRRQPGRRPAMSSPRCSTACPAGCRPHRWGSHNAWR